MKMSNLLVLLAALCLLGACKGSRNSEVISNADTASTVAMDSVASANSKPRLVKTAEMRFKVKDIQKTSEDITTLTQGYKGMVMSNHMQSEPERTQDIRLSTDSVKRISSFYTTASITVKIPSDSLQQFMYQVSKMSIYVNVRKLDIEDKTFDYLTAKLKLDSRTQIINQQKKGKIVIKNPADVIWLKDDMIDQKVSNKRIDDAVKYSVVDLSLYQSNTIAQETIANDDPNVYQIPFFNRLVMALANGWGLFTSFVIGLANLWVFLLAGYGILMLVKLYKRKALPGINSI